MPAKIGKSTAATTARQQRPTKRGRSAARPGTGDKRWQRYLPKVLVVGLCVLALAVLGVSYYAVTASAFFQVREIVVVGAARTSAEDARNIAQRHADSAGIWHADLEKISAEISRLPWVRQAVVSRVLPDGLRVTIKERVKTAVVIANGKAVWVDDEGVKLGPYAPADKVANLILLKGWDERETDEARAGNRQRVATYSAMLADWEALGLTKRISDINLADTRDARVFLRSHPDVPVSLGDRNWGARLKGALQTLADEKRADVIALNAKLDDRVFVVYRNNVAQPAASPSVSPKPNAGR
jgi:cell division septal protein FtsQ